MPQIPHFLANKAAKVSKGDEKVRADCLATDLSKGVEAVKVPVVNEVRDGHYCILEGF